MSSGSVPAFPVRRPRPPGARSRLDQDPCACPPARLTTARCGRFHRARRLSGSQSAGLNCQLRPKLVRHSGSHEGSRPKADRHRQPLPFQSRQTVVRWHARYLEGRQYRRAERRGSFPCRQHDSRATKLVLSLHGCDVRVVLKGPRWSPCAIGHNQAIVSVAGPGHGTDAVAAPSSSFRLPTPLTRARYRRLDRGAASPGGQSGGHPGQYEDEHDDEEQSHQGDLKRHTPEISARGIAAASPRFPLTFRHPRSSYEDPTSPATSASRVGTMPR